MKDERRVKKMKKKNMLKDGGGIIFIVESSSFKEVVRYERSTYCRMKICISQILDIG